MKVRKGSVKITDARGTARLAPDLCKIGPEVVVRINRKKKTIELMHWWNGHRPDLTMWAPHERARIRKIHLGRLIRELGLCPKEMVGQEYRATIKNGVIRINLKS